ncbi:MAG: hypothetical protein Q8Q15_02375, partial [bacterium]|nr:hypothetical protein [bacterium]
AQELAKELGLSLSAVVNAYLKQFVRTKEVYFSSVPRMSTALENLLGDVEKDMKAGRNLSRAISSEEELKRYLAR